MCRLLCDKGTYSLIHNSTFPTLLVVINLNKFLLPGGPAYLSIPPQMESVVWKGSLPQGICSKEFYPQTIYILDMYLHMHLIGEYKEHFGTTVLFLTFSAC